MTASARFADLLLPAPSLFEIDNFIAPWAYGNYLLCNNKVVEPLFESRFEWDWVKAVAEKLGCLEALVDGKPDAEQWREFLYNELRQVETELPPFEQFKREGGYSYKNNRSYIAYKKQREDLKNHPFDTPSGKIEIFSKRIYNMKDPVERPAIPKYVPCCEGPEDPLRKKFPLQLIGWHTKRRTHSIHDKNKWLEEVEPHRVWIHPADAAVRGIADGDMADVFNDRGRVRIRAHVTDRITEGVAGMPQGAWYTPGENGVDTRGNINTLTSTNKPTPFAMGPPQHTNLVEIMLTQKT
jgi:anaerobic dimethyl sulfoxide reductase subunit A